MQQFVDCDTVNWKSFPDDADLMNGRIICLFCNEDVTRWDFHQLHFLMVGNKLNKTIGVKRFICKMRKLNP
jgi:hypothetical protein